MRPARRAPARTPGPPGGARREREERETTRGRAGTPPCGARPTETSGRSSAAPRRGRRDRRFRLGGAREARERELELAEEPLDRVGFLERKAPVRLLAEREEGIDDLPGPCEIHLAAAGRGVRESFHVESRRLREHVEKAKERRVRRGRRLDRRSLRRGGRLRGGIGRGELGLRLRAHVALGREEAAIHDLDRLFTFGHKSTRVSVFYVNAGRLLAWQFRTPREPSWRSWKSSGRNVPGTASRRPATSPDTFSRSATRSSTPSPARTGASSRASWETSSSRSSSSRGSEKSAERSISKASRGAFTTRWWRATLTSSATPPCATPTAFACNGRSSSARSGRRRGVPLRPSTASRARSPPSSRRCA